jgi:hypothetical protein
MQRRKPCNPCHPCHRPRIHTPAPRGPAIVCNNVTSACARAYAGMPVSGHTDKRLHTSADSSARAGPRARVLYAHVLMCMCMCVHVCACMCLYVHVCACMCMYVHVCACMCMYVHVCACMCMYVHVCACMCINMIYACSPGRMHTRMRMRIVHAAPHACGRSPKYACAPLCMHTHPHTRTQMYIGTWAYSTRARGPARAAVYPHARIPAYAQPHALVTLLHTMAGLLDSRIRSRLHGGMGCMVAFGHWLPGCLLVWLFDCLLLMLTLMFMCMLFVCICA